MGGTFRVGSGCEKMVTWKKSSKKSSIFQIARWFFVSIEIHQTVNHQTKKHKSKTLRKSRNFWKTSFCSTEIAKPAPIWCTQKCGIAWNKIHWDPRRWEFVWSQLQPPKIPWQNWISYLLKSSPKNEQTQKWQTTSSFQQFSTNVFSLLVTPNKNKSFPNFVPLRFAWSW